MYKRENVVQFIKTGHVLQADGSLIEMTCVIRRRPRGRPQRRWKDSVMAKKTWSGMGNSII